MGHQEFFDFSGVYILSATDYHVLYAPGDTDEAVFVHNRKISGVHPAIFIDRFIGLLSVAPIAVHHCIAACAVFTLLSARQGRAVKPDNLSFYVRMYAPHCLDSLGQRIVGQGLGGDRARFRHAIRNGYLTHIELFHDRSHRCRGAGRTRHNAGTKRGHIGFRQIGHPQHSDEHCRHTVECRAALCRYRMKRQRGIERIAWIDDGGTGRQSGQVPHDHAEAMIKGDGNANPIGPGEAQCSGCKQTVVENIPMR